MDFAAESDQKYPSAPLVFTASNLCGRPSNNLLFDAPTPAAVGILGEAGAWPCLVMQPTMVSVLVAVVVVTVVVARPWTPGLNPRLLDS